MLCTFIACNLATGKLLIGFLETRKHQPASEWENEEIPLHVATSLISCHHTDKVIEKMVSEDPSSACTSPEH